MFFNHASDVLSLPIRRLKDSEHQPQNHEHLVSQIREILSLNADRKTGFVPINKS